MHRPSLQTFLACAIAVVSGVTGTAYAAPPTTTGPASDHPSTLTAPPKADATVNRVLASMHGVSTWGHPDLFYEFAGMRKYSRGHYTQALNYFKHGALYADKLSQLSIGLMYANGQGVAKDSATACAWLALAAERKYPAFVSTRDRVCTALTPAERAHAVALLDQLLPVYGDKVAKRRMVVALKLSRMQMTGSLLGFDYGVNNAGTSILNQHSDDGGTNPAYCGGATPTIAGVPLPQAGCGGMGYWATVRWDPKEYFAARDARWHGIVTVGNMLPGNEPATPDDQAHNPF